MSTTPLELRPLRRRSLNDEAYARLKSALLAGRLEPGSSLSLRQLAEQFGTSVMPVRAAIAHLAAEGAVVVVPQSGVRIPALTSAEADDVWKLRIDLEGECCARAARRASREDVDRIAALCTAVREAGEAGDLHATLERNSAFQFAIYETAASEVLLRIIETLRLRSVPHCTAAIRRVLAARPPYFDHTWGYHEALVDALSRGDAGAARDVKQRDLAELRALVEAQQEEDA